MKDIFCLNCERYFSDDYNVFMLCQCYNPIEQFIDVQKPHTNYCANYLEVK